MQSSAIQKLSGAGASVLVTKLYVPKLKETDVKRHQIFNIFNANVSTPSQTLNLTNIHKNLKLKILCMPVSSYLACLNVAQPTA